MKFRTLFLMTFCVVGLNACSETPHPEGKPVARQTYSHVGQYGIAASKIEIERVYDPLALQGDISPTLRTPPHVAILDYASHRYVAEGGQDIFRFVLEQASVTKRVIPQANKWVSWTGMADEDEYRFFVVVSVHRVTPGQFSGPGASIKMDRTLVIPQRKSIAERESLQTEFVDGIIRDLDDRVRLIIEQQLGL